MVATGKSSPLSAQVTARSATIAASLMRMCRSGFGRLTSSSREKDAPSRERETRHKPAEGGRGWRRTAAVVRDFRTARSARGKDRSSCCLLDGLSKSLNRRSSVDAPNT